MKLIVSNPRYGSTHITEYYHNLARKSHRVHEFKGSKEFLLDPPLWRRRAYERDIGKWEIEDKVKFIEDKRKEGIEVLYKIHAFHLFQNDWLYDWFKDFYKDDEILVLKRKDMWRALLSMIFHYQGHSPWQKYTDLEEVEFLKRCEKIRFRYDPMLLEKFFYYKECIDRVEGEIIYLEDTKIESNELPWNVDYEEWFNGHQLDKLRKEFDARSN